MKVLAFTEWKPWHKFLFFCGFWPLYGLYYFQVNRLSAPDVSMLEVACSIPVFALIAHGVYFLMDRLLARRRIVAGVVCLLAFYAGVTVLTNWLANLVNGWLESPLDGGRQIRLTDGAFLANMIAMMSQYSLYAAAFFAMNSAVANARAKQVEAEARLREAERRLQAERDKQRYEYLLLSAQVSPHFMANLLDGWRLQLGREHRRIADAMERAYNLMVYYMEARLPAKRRVPLAMEISQLEAYTELAGHRGKSAHIQFHHEGELTGYTLPPTTLLTFLENSTKHGRTDLAEHPVRMEVTVADGKLSCICRNRVKEVPDTQSHGVGFANLRRRLELEYGSRFRLEANRKGDEYIVQLTIHYQ